MWLMDRRPPLPQRRYPSPSAQRRRGEYWKVRLGLTLIVLVMLSAAAIIYRIVLPG